MATTSAAGDSDTRRISRGELLIVALIVLSAFGLRFAFPERLAVEHFDEGIYASNVWFGDKKEKTYPEQHLYAPPLLPALIECSFLVSGPSNPWAMFPGQLLGALTPLALWWLGREWFGRVTGSVAAMLCACSDVHILLSRSALTDVPLGLWWVLAMLTLRDACTSGRFLAGVVAGGCVGLAWWTKYNGWMPLGIALAAIILRGILLIGRGDERGWRVTRTAIFGWMISTTTAVLIWLPWVWSLQSRGGYAAVLANHRRYVVGFMGWSTSLERQLMQLVSLSGLFSTVSFVLVFGVVPFLMARFRARANGLDPNTLGYELPTTTPMGGSRNVIRKLLVGICALALSFLYGVFSIAVIVAQAILGITNWCVIIGSRHGLSPESKRTELSGLFLFVWFFGLLISTPLYHPYLRLTVPGLLASFLGAGLFAQMTTYFSKFSNGVSGIELVPPDPRTNYIDRVFEIIAILAMLIILYYLTWGSFGRAFNPGTAFPDRTGLVAAAKSIRDVVEPPMKGPAGERTASAVYVFAEPALLFQLRLAGLPNVGPAGSLKFSQVHRNSSNRIYLATGIHAQQDPEFQRQFEELKHLFKPVGHWQWHLSPLVRLDQPGTDPSGLGGGLEDQVEVELFEVLTE